MDCKRLLISVSLVEHYVLNLQSPSETLIINVLVRVMFDNEIIMNLVYDGKYFTIANQSSNIDAMIYMPAIVASNIRALFLVANDECTEHTNCHFRSVAMFK